MKYDKVIWFIRAVVYKLLWGKVGIKCLLGKPLFLLNGRRVYLGRKVRIFPFYRMECHNGGKIIIGDNVSIGQNFHIISSGNELKIGNDCLISANVFISNCEHRYGTQELIESKTIIHDGCFIGYGAVILPGTKLGKNCIVGANSVVKGNFDDQSVIVGSPARVIKTSAFS